MIFMTKPRGLSPQGFALSFRRSGSEPHGPFNYTLSIIHYQLLHWRKYSHLPESSAGIMLYKLSKKNSVAYNNGAKSF